MNLKNEVRTYFLYGDNSHVIKKLKEVPIETYLDAMVEAFYLFTREKKRAADNNVYLTDTAVNIGKAVNRKTGHRMSSVDTLRIGIFFLSLFEETGIISVQKGWKKKHQVYVIKVLQDNVIRSLYKKVPKTRLTRLPFTSPLPMWTGALHATGKRIVKTRSKEVLEELTPEKYPIVFNVLNKAQETGWKVNQQVFEVQKWAIEAEAAVFQDIFANLDPEAKKTKLREAATIFDIASQIGDSVFYHLYYLDFRGRKYVATPYLHEQGSDIARGLLLREEAKEVGNNGWFWLLVNLSNTWGGKVEGVELKSDKLPPKARKEWAEKNIDMFLSFANNPKENTKWMDADKPWQFLAGCFELQKVIENGLGYRSPLEVFIDGSNNGSQHLTMLTKDEETAPLVNLIPQDLPGDLYAYVSEHMWKYIDAEVATYDEDIVVDCEHFIDRLIELKRKGDFEAVKDLKARNMELSVIAAPVFWARIKDPKERRKIVKRNVMSLPYGATAYGLGNQQWDDAKRHGIELLYFLEPKWGYWFGRKIFVVSEELIKRPMRLLRLFETAGEDADRQEKFLKWRVPITNFPCEQHYVQGRIKKVQIQYRDLNLQLHVSMEEELEKMKGKQAQGAAPNIIHSLDAAHLMLTVDAADFTLTTVHDSYGCLLGDMHKLYPLVRRTFVDLYQGDVLKEILLQVGLPTFKDYGNFDINSVLEAQYAFI